ncbi:MAG: L,D-transpeptidase [Negativicutes bacterium]|nr:L,D-transpeptidase [Negativicutes bacterium]
MTHSITVNLAVRQLILYENGLLRKKYAVGIGRMLTPTPTGTFTIVSKTSKPGGPFGVVWMGLSAPHYGIHGTNDPASIGHIVSHGCIRMYNQDAAELARIVEIGTPVKIVDTVSGVM